MPPLAALIIATAKKERDKIPFKHQLVMIHAELRGAIAFALALGFPTQHKEVIIDTTTWVVLFTIFVLSGSTTAVLGIMGIQTGFEEPKEAAESSKEGSLQEELLVQP